MHLGIQVVHLGIGAGHSGFQSVQLGIQVVRPVRNSKNALGIQMVHV